MIILRKTLIVSVLKNVFYFLRHETIQVQVLHKILVHLIIIIVFNRVIIRE